jgi:hypothetical protein
MRLTNILAAADPLALAREPRKAPRKTPEHSRAEQTSDFVWRASCLIFASLRLERSGREPFRLTQKHLQRFEEQVNPSGIQ